MERRSGRLRTFAPKSMAEDGSDVEMDDRAEAETVVKKPRKRRAVTVALPKNVSSIQAQFKRPKGNRGLLKDVVDMPMDVVYEIFSQLDPMDLLNLARTTKDLRGILMSRASKSVWKQAFTNVSPPGLPDCPSDLNEPQYAELAFGRTCTFCDRKLPIIHIVWAARVRTCNKCLDKNFSTDILYEPFALRDLVPGLHVQSRGPSGRRRGYGKFLIYQEVSRQWRQDYDALKGPEKRDWVENKVAERQLVRKHATQCERWAESRQSQLQDEKASIVEDRKAIVMDYIRTLGWGEELDKIPGGVRKPENEPAIVKFCQKDITQRGLDGMTDYLNEHMEGVKSKRIFREQKEALQTKVVTLKETYTSHLLKLPPTEFYPNTADIYADQNVKEILKGTTTELSTEQLDILNAMFPELLQTWQEPLTQRLLQLISQDAPSEKFVFDPSSVLDLVTTSFMCSHCVSHLQAKQAMTHRCTRDPLYMYGKTIDEEQELLKSTIKEIRWNVNNCLAFSPVTSKRIAEALDGCSIDPMTTVAEIEKIDPVFECLTCHNVLSGRCMMKWAGLYSHSNGHSVSRPMKLILVGEEDAVITRARMKEEYERHHARDHRSSMCTHCRNYGGLLAMLDHVKTIHEVAKPEPGVDVIISPGSSLEPFVFRFWPPRLKEDVDEMIGEVMEAY